jgi:hypothetical protein
MSDEVIFGKEAGAEKEEVGTEKEVTETTDKPREQNVTTMPLATHDLTPAVRTGPPRDSQPMPLFSGNDAQALRSRWETLQIGFVDEPKNSVEEADRLVSETINTLSRGFAAEREKLEAQWHRGEDVSTEDLRLALRRYRSFFERLLSI